MMSRVKQRAAIGCPHSPRTFCTVLIESEGGGAARVRMRAARVTFLRVCSSSSYKDANISVEQY